MERLTKLWCWNAQLANYRLNQSFRLQISSLEFKKDVASPCRFVSFYQNISFSFYQEQRRTQYTEQKKLYSICGYMMWTFYGQKCYSKRWVCSDCKLRFIEFHNTQRLGRFYHLNFSILLQIITIITKKSSLEIIS